MALPEGDSRAPITTSLNAEIVMLGIIAMLSSSVTSAGKSFSCNLATANGIGGPLLARA